MSPRFPQPIRLSQIREGAARPVLGLACLALLLTGCASGPSPSELQARAALAACPLQATSLQPLPSVASPAPPPLPAEEPAVTRPWMEEQLRKFDDRYAGAAADIRVVFEQAVASLKSTVSPADLTPLTAATGKVDSDLTSLAARTESLVSGLQARLKALEQALAEATKPPTVGSSVASDPDTQTFLDALKALQGSPRQTLPLRAWLEDHPKHSKAPEALLQLAMGFLDGGYPTAAHFYFSRLTERYPTSPQAAEAKALGALPKPPPPHRKPPRKPVAPSATAPGGKPEGDPKPLGAAGATHTTPSVPAAAPASPAAPQAPATKEKAPGSVPASSQGPAPAKTTSSTPALPAGAPTDHVSPSGLLPHPNTTPPVSAATAPPIPPLADPAAKQLKESP